jgi:hypothetical protein
MRQVYLWLALGLVVCFGVSYLVGNAALSAYQSALATRNVPDSFLFNPVVMIVSVIAYLILAFTIQPIIMRANLGVGSAVYLLFAGLFGFMISYIFLIYKPGTIATAFVASAGMFGAMSIVGYTTKMDLSRLGNVLIMALIGLFIATILNIFLRLEMLFWLINYAGVIIFAGLTAYDTQWIKNNAQTVATSWNREAVGRLALVGALHLFLDFVNLFLFILRIMGGSSRD